jgi:pimeloyl-ACP methyl ester carboxylesterase
MPFATNPIDGCKVYYEDDGGDGPPVVIMGGFSSSVAANRFWPVAQALGDAYRSIYIDHRGHGQSDKPHDEAAYALPTRVADVTAVLDELGLAKAHFVTVSYGARLAYAVAELASERVQSLTACGMGPYALGRGGPLVSAIDRAMDGAGMEAFADALSAFMLVEGPVRDALLANDHAALAASWKSGRNTGAISDRLSEWMLPCLIYAGTDDADFFELSKRAAAEIPGATFLEMPGLTHFSCFADDSITPRIKQHIAAAT